MAKIIYSTGDLVLKADNGQFDIVIHCCNCFNNMGAGIAKFLKVKWPECAKTDNKTIKGDLSKLGTCSFAEVKTCTNKKLTICNAYGQFHYAAPPIGKEVNCDYDALESSFGIINERFKNMKDAKIGMPKIGAGRAKGDWNKITEIIERVMTNFETIEVVLYDKWDKFNG